MEMFYGREEEQAILQKVYQSKKPEFVALYGRRRVGKTHLIRNAFSGIKDGLFFYVTGTKNGKRSAQIQNFTDEIASAFIQPGLRLEVKKNWLNTFRLLTEQIQSSKKKKIVLFFDEFPWMVTRKSALLETLEYFWNRHWSTDPRIKLIICGSSSGWILKHIINNTEGLYNRVTERIHLEPFNLQQTKGYLLSRKVKVTNKQITDLYMVLGGIPHYLNQIKSGLSAAQVVEELAFKKKGFLVTEFKNLYATLFGTADGHVELARAISQHHYGIGQEELLQKIPSLTSGGRLSETLEDLIEAGFIERFTPFTYKKKGVVYKMTDEYSLFYFRWIEPIKETLLDRGMRKGYWEALIKSPAWHSWAGYAFESLCYKHIPQISIALNLSPAAIPYAWRSISVKGSEDSGAQIDLLFDRKDNAITICEIKYTEKPFEINKSTAEALNKKLDVFKEKTKTKKQLFLTFVSASDLKKTMYSEEMVSGVATLDDLFRKV